MFTLFFRADAAISATRKNFLTLSLAYQPVANLSSITGIPLYAQKSGGNATLFTGYFAYSRNGWWTDFSTFQIQNDLTPTGFVWSHEMGWIDMSGSDPSSTIQIYNDGNIRRIKGKTLGQTAGWIDFNKTVEASKQAYIYSSGKLHGWAWSENYGWIDFDDGVQQ